MEEKKEGLTTSYNLTVIIINIHQYYNGIYLKRVHLHTFFPEIVRTGLVTSFETVTRQRSVWNVVGTFERSEGFLPGRAGNPKKKWEQRHFL